MKPYRKNGTTNKAPFLPVNSSCADAQPGFEGEAAWLSFCAASFADSAQSLSPQASKPRTHENLPGPKRRSAARRDAMAILLQRWIAFSTTLLCCCARGGVLHDDSHGGAEVTEVLAGPERIPAATNTPYPRPRLVSEVDDTPPEDVHDVRLATKGVVRDVARCSIDRTEHVVVAAFVGGVRDRQAPSPLVPRFASARPLAPPSPVCT